MTDAEAEVARLRMERRGAAELEQSLRTALEGERHLRVAAEAEVDALRASLSFRVGSSVVLAVKAAQRHRPGRASARAAVRGLRYRRAEAPLATPAGTPGAHAPAGTVLFVAWQADADAVLRLAERVERLHAVLVGFRPLFLVDSEHVAPLRARGYPFEYLIPLDEWRQVRAPADWGAYVTAQVAALAAEHRPALIVVLDSPERASPLDQGVLDALVLPGLALTDDNLIVPPISGAEAFSELVEELLEADEPGLGRRQAQAAE